MRCALLRFALWMAFAIPLFQSITAVAAWWEDPDSLAGWRDWLWVGAFPLLLTLYLRYFSILGCKAGCVVPAEAPGEGPRRPN